MRCKAVKKQGQLKKNIIEKRGQSKNEVIKKRVYQKAKPSRSKAIKEIMKHQPSKKPMKSKAIKKKTFQYRPSGETIKQWPSKSKAIKERDFSIVAIRKHYKAAAINQGEKPLISGHQKTRPLKRETF